MKKSKSLTKTVAHQFRNWKKKKNKFLFRKRLETIFPFVPKKAKVLDAGCGDFDMLDALKNAKKIVPYGVDIMPHDSRIIKADCSKLPFKKEFFDCVLFIGTIEHIPNQIEVLIELKRVLKKGGKLIITTPNPLYSWAAWLGSLFGLKYKEGFDNSIPLGKLKSKVKESGFNIKIAKGFLLMPFKNPLSFIEKFIAKPILGYTLLMNQLVVCEKNNKNEKKKNKKL